MASTAFLSIRHVYFLPVVQSQVAALIWTPPTPQSVPESFSTTFPVHPPSFPFSPFPVTLPCPGEFSPSLTGFLSQPIVPHPSNLVTSLSPPHKIPTCLLVMVLPLPKGALLSHTPAYPNTAASTPHLWVPGQPQRLSWNITSTEKPS